MFKIQVELFLVLWLSNKAIASGRTLRTLVKSSSGTRGRSTKWSLPPDSETQSILIQLSPHTHCSYCIQMLMWPKCYQLVLNWLHGGEIAEMSVSKMFKWRDCWCSLFLLLGHVTRNSFRLHLRFFLGFSFEVSVSLTSTTGFIERSGCKMVKSELMMPSSQGHSERIPN